MVGGPFGPERRSIAVGRPGPSSGASLDPVELGERLHVDLGADGRPVGMEILYPSLGDVDLQPLRDRYGCS